MLKRKSKNYMANRISYKANKKDCILCHLKEKCISGKGNFRIVSHYDSPCYEKALSYYYSNYGKVMQKLRGTVIEGVVGQAKTYHGMSKAKFRGLSKVHIQFLLTATALNLKKMIKMLERKTKEMSISRKICSFIKLIESFFSYHFKKLIFQEALATDPICYSPSQSRL